MTAVLELDQEGELLWARAVEEWNEQARHDRFVQRCYATGRLAAAAARYAARLQEHPDDETARRMKERVVFLSVQAVVAGPARAAARRPLMQSPWFVAVVLVGAALGAALGIIYGARP